MNNASGDKTNSDTKYWKLIDASQAKLNQAYVRHNEMLWEFNNGIVVKLNWEIDGLVGHD